MVDKKEPNDARNRPGTPDKEARQRPDQARNAGSKVNLEEKANPTKPQQVHDDNVNRPHSSS